MRRLQDGSFRLARVAGVNVYLHWSWFLVAGLQVQLQLRLNRYSRPAWNVAEYLLLFLIVLLHEFGHALACRSVGGEARRIVLWPLGGVAYVVPPPRPGPLLWSIAAGPLVNLLLVPITFGLALAGPHFGWWPPRSDPDRLALILAQLNVVLLVFNLLPIYPLDGGQIAHALLWFLVGRWRGLQAVSFLGMVVGLVAVALALFYRRQLGGGGWLLVAIAAYVVYRALLGFLQANAVLRLLRSPRHHGASCPDCGEAPLAGPNWACDECGTPFDIFAHPEGCPGCGATFQSAECLLCHHSSLVMKWYPPDRDALAGEEEAHPPSQTTRNPM
jgi:Zn-dependent protease